MPQKTKHFNLLKEDWIPVLWSDGRYGRIGIIEALMEAGGIRQIAATNPIDQVAIIRFLLALLYWCKPSLNEAEQAMLTAPTTIPNEWLHNLHQHEPDFALLGDGKRFMQPPAVDGQENVTKRPVADLFHELPGQTNIAHFHHVRDYRVGVCPACVAVGFVRLPCAMTCKGRGKPPGINGAPPLYFVPVGDNLLETLLLNWPYKSATNGGVSRHENLSWISEQQTDSSSTIGIAEGFTWTSRQYRIDDESLTSGSCILCGERTKAECLVTTLYEVNRPNGRAGLTRTEQWRDPHVARLTRSKGKTLRAENTESNPVAAAGQWRKWLKTISSATADDFESPRLIQEALEMQPHKPIRVLIAGLATQKDKSIESLQAVLTAGPLSAQNEEELTTSWGAIEALERSLFQTIDPRLSAWEKPVKKLKDALLLRMVASNDGLRLHSLRSQFAHRIPALEKVAFDEAKKNPSQFQKASTFPSTLRRASLKAIRDAVRITSPCGIVGQLEATKKACDAFNETIKKVVSEANKKEDELATVSGRT